MSRITTLIALTCSLVVAGTAGAQTVPDRDAIVAAVNKFFAGMKARDTAMMSSTSMPGATMAYAAYRAGKTTTGGAMAATQAVNVAAMAEAADERLLGSEVWQDGDIATVWGPYEIFLGAKQLHCGYDGFNMARVEGVWQFSSVIYSARPDECESIRAVAKGAPRKATSVERAEVLKAVEGFFTAMRKKDSTALANSFTERANWTSAVYRGGKVTVSRRMASLDVDRMSKSKQALDERFIGPPTVRIDGDVALVWGYYQFKVDNTVSHCGYDSFHMLKENGAWKIESGTYTVRPDGCKKP